MKFNMACIRLFEGIKYVLPILHPNKKRLALIMCPEEDSASVEWARQKDENWVNKDITSLEFVENIFRLMNWNRECRYKVLGRVANSDQGLCMNLLVTIPAESRRMNVGKDVIRVLGSPAYICVLQRKDRKAIAITPCAAEHPMSFKVPGRLLTDGQCRMMINGIQFIQVLLEANGLAAGKDHQFKGRYDAEKNAVIISLEKDEQSALSPQKCTT